MSTSHVFPRRSDSQLPTAVAGEGCWLVDAKGQRYLDASGGAAVSCLGHSAKPVLDAICQQLQQLAYAHTSFFTTEPAEQLADLLIQHASGNLDRVYFVSGGSEAMEASLKLCRQYFLEINQPQRSHLIARRQSYHGNTLGVLSAGGNQWRRQPFEPLLSSGVSHISPCYYYRGAESGEPPEEYGLRVANELEAEILRAGPERVAAFLAEPVVGATLGAIAPVPGYFGRIREICDQYGVLLVLDEVMCGMGRTGSLFAYEQEGIAPDVVCIAKGLGAGLQPIGAMLCTDTIYQAIAQGSGFFQHGHTYQGHPTACAAGVAVLQEMLSQNLPVRVKEKGERLYQVLQQQFAEHPNVGDVRGRGLFLGIELVQDKQTKEPLNPKFNLPEQIRHTAMQQGLLCYPMGGTIDGRRGHHILLAPPFIINDEELDLIVSRLSSTLNATLPALDQAA
ncbi:MAG: aspartate aminotransferase family protein [SAR324 cluster bacterium]|nr:aspartate aminotransferase family protein [SAR324 cluster bacterium]